MSPATRPKGGLRPISPLMVATTTERNCWSVTSCCGRRPPEGRPPPRNCESGRRRFAEIVVAKLTFADAARKYSDGPSRKDGGRLGWIGRHGPMDEAFSRAAFALNVGEVSPPVTTAFGVDLIRCDQLKPGEKKLADVRRELEDALSRELLDKLAGIERGYTPVKYTGVLPHFKPGTHQLEPAAKRPNGL